MKKSLLPFYLLIMLVVSCTNDKETTVPEDPSSCRIKSMIITDYVSHDIIGMFNYQYDAQGRVTEMITQTSAVSDPFIHRFEYYPTAIFDNISLSGNAHWGRIIYTLNSAGYATTELHVGYGMPGDSDIMSTVVSKYDANGFRNEENYYLRDDTVTYKWQIVQGNTISLDLWNTFGTQDLLTETYQHFSNTASTLENSNRGMLFLGKSNVNLVKSSAIASPIPQSATYTYEFDSKNRVTKKFVRGSGILTGACDVAVSYY